MLDGLTHLQLAYAALVVFAAYFVRGIAGFGSALVAVPLLAMILPVPFIVPIIVLVDYTASLVHSTRNFHHIRWREIVPMVPASATGVAVALYLLNHARPGALTAALGVFVIAYALYSLTPLPPLRGSRLWAAPLGFLAGLVGTVFGTGGPFTVIYLTLRELDKTAFRGTIATIFIIDGGMRLTGFASTGLFDRDNLLIALMMLPLMGIGMYAGGHVHTNLDRSTFVRIVSVILLGSGAGLLLK